MESMLFTVVQTTPADLAVANRALLDTRTAWENAAEIAPVLTEPTVYCESGPIFKKRKLVTQSDTWAK